MIKVMEIGKITKVSPRELRHKEDFVLTLINEMSKLAKSTLSNFQGRLYSGSKEVSCFMYN